MKIAFYVEDGLEQVVLSPENETERAILGKLHDGSRDFEMYHGGFYHCQGGWVRQRDPMQYYERRAADDDRSTIIVLRKPEPKATP